MFYDHMAKRASPDLLSDRAKRDKQVCHEIDRVWEQNDKVYGVRKVWHPLRREGFDLARCTVARLMKDMGLEGVRRGKKVRTTISDPTDVELGTALTPRNTPHSNGSTGSTIAACWNPSGISRQPKRKQTASKLRKDQTGPRNQQKSAFDKSDAVHLDLKKPSLQKVELACGWACQSKCAGLEMHSVMSAFLHDLYGRF